MYHRWIGEWWESQYGRVGLFSCLDNQRRKQPIRYGVGVGGFFQTSFFFETMEVAENKWMQCDEGVYINGSNL